MVIRAAYHQYGRTLIAAAIAVMLAVSSIILAPATDAQSGSSTARESITMSPTSRNYTVNAGAVTNDKLTIVNDGTTDYDFLMYARPYSIVDNQYDKPDFTNAAPNADLYGWVQFPQTKYHIKAGTSVEVPFTVRIPATAAPGGHYGVVFAEVQPVAQQSSGNSVLRKKRVGSIIYATVNGAVKKEGNSVSITIPSWQQQAPLQATTVVRNSGNVHFADKVTVTVRDVLGNVKYRSAKDFQVLPDTSRTIVSSWDRAPWFGLYKVKVEQEFLGKKEQSEGYVLMMPRFLPFVLLTVVIIGGLYASLRRHKK